MEPIKQYKAGGYSVRLYTNRIEEETSSFFGKQTDTILLKTVTNIAAGVGRVLTITTQDGKRHALKIGGKDGEDWRKVILEVMP